MTYSLGLSHYSLPFELYQHGWVGSWSSLIWVGQLKTYYSRLYPSVRKWFQEYNIILWFMKTGKHSKKILCVRAVFDRLALFWHHWWIQHWGKQSQTMRLISITMWPLLQWIMLVCVCRKKDATQYCCIHSRAIHQLLNSKQVFFAHRPRQKKILKPRPPLISWPSSILGRFVSLKHISFSRFMCMAAPYETKLVCMPPPQHFLPFLSQTTAAATPQYTWHQLQILAIEHMPFSHNNTYNKYEWSMNLLPAVYIELLLHSS